MVVNRRNKSPANEILLEPEVGQQEKRARLQELHVRQEREMLVLVEDIVCLTLSAIPLRSTMIEVADGHFWHHIRVPRRLGT